MDIHSALSWLAQPGAYAASKTAFWGLTNALRLELAEQKTQVVGAHLGYTDTPLIAHLQMLRVNSLTICGESTSGCVRASTVDAYSYGFHNVLVEECTYDRSMLSHKVNLFDLHHKYADVLHVDEVLAHLDGLAVKRKVA